MKILAWFRITDEDGQLSLTNLAMYVTLVRLALVPAASVVDVGALLLALGNYGYKRWLTAAMQPVTPQVDVLQVQAHTTELQDIRKEISTLKSALALSGMTGR